jgi:hypothetical protein
MSHLCNRCVRELLILARTWFAFGLPLKPGVTKRNSTTSRGMRYGILFHVCRRFDPGGSLDRRVNCRCVSQPRWVDARRNTKGGKRQGETAAFVLSYAQGGCACSRGLQAFARERERDRPPARSPTRPPSRTRALGLPFIDVRRGPRCTMGV